MAEQIAFKTILKYGATVVGNLISVTGPGLKVDFVETTNHGLSDPYRTYRPTLVDPGEADFKVQMTSTNATALEGLIDPTAAATTWTITYPYGTPIVVTMTGWLSEWQVESADVDGLLTVNMKIKITGKPTIA